MLWSSTLDSVRGGMLPAPTGGKNCADNAYGIVSFTTNSRPAFGSQTHTWL